jgi:5-carboxymethyl-2-hydroxymuconate isomerase
MPHLIVEYSANLEDRIDIAGLCETLRATAAAHEAFPMPGVRVRAYPAHHFAIADGDPKHGFIDIGVRLREGRPADVKRDATDTLFAAVRGFLAQVMETHSIALSLEMRDIAAEYAPKFGTIRDHLQYGGG